MNLYKNYFSTEAQRAQRYTESNIKKLCETLSSLWLCVEKKIKIFSIIFIIIFCLSSCRKDIIVYPPENDDLTNPEFTSVQGFYLLNEGNMGSNKASLDYFDYETGNYYRNIYPNVNPNVPKELGDVGNDIAIYGSKLYAVINCSHKVEVMDAKTAKRIGQINIQNCRNITFDDGFAYITSYTGPVDPNQQQIGYVAKVDTSSLKIVEKCLVGYQPDGLVISNGKIYVANSGGYLTPNTENRVSVIDVLTFKEIKNIPVAKNLHRIYADKYGNVWVSSRGDYYGSPSKLYCLDSKTDQLTDSISIAVSNFYLDEDKLYIVSAVWSYETMSNEVNYGIVDVVSKQIITNNFITDGTETGIVCPYGIAVNPITKDILVADAKNFIYPGILYCFDKEGKKRWEVHTGDIPAHFVFLLKKS